MALHAAGQADRDFEPALIIRRAEGPPGRSVGGHLRHGLRTSAGRCLVLVCLVLLSGCGYMVGGAYRSDIQTVHVPIFTSNSFRRGLEFQLTEAVQKRIQMQTPFRLADRQHADTLLTGHIVEVRKDVLSETADDLPRELQFLVAIEVTWQDLRTGNILHQEEIPIPAEVVHLSSTSQFAPEVGQSLATAEHEAFEELARKIVNMMESPW